MEQRSAVELDKLPHSASAAPQQHPSRRRRQATPPRGNKNEFLQHLKQEYFLDILRARGHTKHFRHTRSQTISNRVRTLAFLLGVLIPAWISVDTLYLAGEQMLFVAVLRLLCGGALLGLAFWHWGSHNLLVSRIKLALLVVIPSLFHTVTQLYLSNAGHGLPPGYHFFPFMIITLGAIFPLTIFEGALLASFVTLLHLLSAFLQGQLTSHATLNDIWLLVLLALITGWAALTQLTMLMRLYRQANRDSLTGLANRRSIVSYLAREVEHCRTHSSPLSLMLLDLDRFKRINDRYGHAVGDQVLKRFAELLFAESRAEDLPGRFGGEEFLMILTGTDQAGASAIAERLRLSCHNQQVVTPSGEQLGFSTSIGVTELRPDDTIEQALKRVDEALYAAKGGGRDRVVVA